MALTISEMVQKGRAALARKVPEMKANYDAAKPKMQASYDALPFGPRTKGAYRKGIADATYRTPDVEKWARNFQAGVSR